MSISSSSVLVELNISVWTANKLDKDATNKLTYENRATVDAAQVRKNLMAGTTLRKDIADFAAGCRLWHNARTLPWSDRGPRLLPTSLFLPYKTEANERRDTFMRMTDKFRVEYPKMLETRELAMGDLHNPDDYPPVDEVMDKFGFRLVFSPVPESGDFRLDIPQQDLAEIRQEYDANFVTRIEEAMRSPWEKLHDMLAGMSAKLTESDDETKKRWHDTFVTNAQDMCAMLTHLNITGDPKLEAARRQLEQALINIDIDDIKEEVGVRVDLKQKVDNILKGFDW
jgi:hypothetical protein